MKSDLRIVALKKFLRDNVVSDQIYGFLNCKSDTLRKWSPQRPFGASMIAKVYLLFDKKVLKSEELQEIFFPQTSEEEEEFYLLEKVFEGKLGIEIFDMDTLLSEKEVNYPSLVSFPKELDAKTLLNAFHKVTGLTLKRLEDITGLNYIDPSKMNTKAMLYMLLKHDSVFPKSFEEKLYILKEYAKISLDKRMDFYQNVKEHFDIVGYPEISDFSVEKQEHLLEKNADSDVKATSSIIEMMHDETSTEEAIQETPESEENLEQEAPSASPDKTQLALEFIHALEEVGFDLDTLSSLPSLMFIAGVMDQKIRGKPDLRFGVLSKNFKEWDKSVKITPLEVYDTKKLAIELIKRLHIIAQQLPKDTRKSMDELLPSLNNLYATFEALQNTLPFEAGEEIVRKKSWARGIQAQ